MSVPEVETTPEDTPPPRRKRRAGRILLWSGATLAVLVLAVALGVLAIRGQPIRAPDWLRSDISERINDDLQGVQLEFGDVFVMLERDWVPRLKLSKVTIRNAAGGRLAVLTDLESTMALRPLLRGRVQPATIRLSGATVRLRRSAEGNVGLTVGDTPGTMREAPDLARLIQQMDRFLQRPAFAALKRVEAGNLTIQYEDVRAGRVWTVDGGRIEVVREDDRLQVRGDFALLGRRGYATTLALNYDGEIGATAAQFGVSFEDMPARAMAGQTPALAFLDALDAPISGALRASVGEDGRLGPLNAFLEIGAGVLQPTQATAPIPFNEARTYFTYHPLEQVMQFDEIFVDSDWVTARVEGKAFLIGVERGWPTELWTQFQVSELRANPRELYPEPVEIEGAVLEARLKFDPFEVTLGQMSFSDRGQQLVLTGGASAVEGGWSVALDGRMDGVAPERLLQLWPEQAAAPTRKWIAENVVSAEVSDIQLAVRSVPKHRPDVFLGFDFAGLETRFIKQVPHIREGAGHGSLYGNRFVVVADRGYVPAAEGGRVDIAGTSLTVLNTSIKHSPARVRLKADGAITAVLSLLDSPPFRFLQKAGRPVTLADGQLRAEGRLEFQLKKKVQPEDVSYDISAEARDVRSETLVPGRVLVAPELSVVAQTGELQISGDGRLGRVPVSGQWTAQLGKDTGGKSTLSGQIELSERFADEFNIGLPPGSISGAGQGEIAVDFVRGQPGRFRLTSDLGGLGLALKPLGWALSRPARGRLEVSGTLGQPPGIDRIALDAGGLVAEGALTLKPGGQLERASFSRVQLDDWLNAPVDLIGRGANVAPAVRVRGGTVDLRQTSLAGEGDGGRRPQGGPVSLALDRLQISDGIALTDFRADLDMSRGADGKFTGRVNGGAPVTGRVVPHEGRSAFRIQSANAGAVLKSAKLLKSARNGQMDLVLFPATARGSYNGKLTVTQLRLKDAPSLAALLNTLSVVGLLEQLDGEGIHFSDVEADFQLTPDRVILQHGSAVGASMGISMDGYYYLESGQMDMQGVISPIYVVNGIGQIFSRRGEGLIGFNYTLKGPASNPRVSVNPLSMLTPGVFRELFRRPAPEVQR